MDLFKELGYLAIASRMQKFVDNMRKDASMIYEEHGISFESKWFPVIYVLSKKSPLGVVELAETLRYAHPSAIALVKELEAKKLVKSVADKNDKRKRQLSLTPKAMDMIGKMEPLWEKMTDVIGGFADNKHNLLRALEEAEAQLEKSSFYERMKNYQKKRLR